MNIELVIRSPSISPDFSLFYQTSRNSEWNIYRTVRRKKRKWKKKGGGERETKEENSITTFRPGSDSNNYKQEMLRNYLARNEVKNGATAATNFSPN